MLNGVEASVLAYLRTLDVTGTGENSDAVLLERYITREDMAAFAELVHRHGPLVWAVCRRVLGHEAEAEDAFQATFLVFVRKARSIDKQENVRSWLYSVAVRVAARARGRVLRRQIREQELRDGIGDKAVTHDEVLWRELRSVLDAEVNRLPAHERLPVILCYLEGKTYAEAASELGCPKGTVAARVARGRERLRHRLARRDVTLTVGLLSAVLTREAVSGPVPSALYEATVEAGTAFATGGAAAGTVSAGAVSLAEGVVSSMFWTTAQKLVVLMILTVTLAFGGSGLLMYSALGAAPVPEQAAASKVEEPTQLVPKPVPTKRDQPREADEPRKADEPKKADAKKAEAKYKDSVEKGLKWLVEQQKKDGHWEGPGAQNSLTMTALSGLALFSEGSTTAKGKYKEPLRNAVEWMMSQAQKDGALGDRNHPGNAGRYMNQHGYATFFLSQAYGLEKDKKRKKEIEEVLEKAVEFAEKAQTSKGGWGFVSARDGGDFDEVCSSEMVMHGVFAARKADIEVSKDVIKRSLAYLEKCNAVSTKDKDPRKRVSGLVYSLANVNGQARPAETAGAVALLLNAGEENDLTVSWLNYLQSTVPIGKNVRFGHDEYILFYYAQAVYQLGEEGHANLRTDLKEKKERRDLLKWNEFRKTLYDSLVASQEQDGWWKNSIYGDVYTTSVYLIVLQLDKANLPFCKR